MLLLRSCVVVLVAGVLSSGLCVVSEDSQLVRHGRTHECWEVPVVHLLWPEGQRPALFFDDFVSIVAAFETLKKLKTFKFDSH